MKRRLRYNLVAILFFGWLASVLISCAPRTTMNKDGSTVKHYIGYIRIITPPTASPGDQYDVSDVETYGLWIKNGVGVGYSRDHIEHIPLDCRLVIKVANQQQLDEVLKTLTPITKEGLCVSVSRK